MGIGKYVTYPVMVEETDAMTGRYIQGANEKRDRDNFQEAVYLSVGECSVRIGLYWMVRPVRCNHWAVERECLDVANTCLDMESWCGIFDRSV